MGRGCRVLRKEWKQVLGSVLEAKTSWMGGFKETTPVLEKKPSVYRDKLMPHGILGYFKILIKLHCYE